MKLLHITLIQPDIVWEDKEANLSRYEKCIAEIVADKHLVVLPEMFSTGFSMAAEKLAEPMNGPTVQWMSRIAAKFRCILTGSLIIEEEGKYYNRMVWMQPDGSVGIYDKRHLFAYGGEDRHYTPGNTRKIMQVNSWRINVQICYDLRFPVWARNQGEEYDILIYVANWPRQRSLAWKALLQARAIENMCYVVGVNRVGTDGNGHHYNGDSSIFDPLGELIWQNSGEETCHTETLDKYALQAIRAKMPFLNDADKFILL